MGNIVSIKGIKEFKCIGGECEYTCCSGWKINLTKADYKRLKKVGVDVKSNIGVSEDKDTINYGAMKVYADTHNCAFLDVDGLCKIHKEHGHEVLPIVCKVYPRLYKKVGNDYEIGLALSCEEVVREFVLNGRVEFEQRQGIINNITTDLGLTINQQLIHDKLKWLGIDILRLEGYLMIEKLYILEYIYKVVLENMNKVGIDKAIELGVRGVEVKIQEGLLNGVELKPLTMVLNILIELSKERGLSNDLLSLITKLEAILSNDGIDKYDKGLNKYLVWEQENSKVVENMMILIFYNYFNLEVEQFMRFLINYMNMFINIVAIRSLQEDIDERLLIDVIVRLNRGIMHDIQKIKLVANYI